MAWISSHCNGRSTQVFIENLIERKKNHFLEKWFKTNELNEFVKFYEIQIHQVDVTKRRRYTSNIVKIPKEIKNVVQFIYVKFVFLLKFDILYVGNGKIP